MANGRRINKRKLGTLISCVIFIVLLAGVFFVGIPMMREENNDSNNSITHESSSGKKFDSSQSEKANSNKNGSSADSSSPNTSNAVKVRGEVDNWAGWFSLIGANLCNSTSSDSYFGKSGLDVSITPVDSDEEKLQHLIDGEIDFTACTINRLALISGNLASSDTAVVVPLFTDSSNGGDAIIARSQFSDIESLKDASIGVGEGSVSHTVIVWAIQQTDLPDSQKLQIIGNIKTYPSASEAKDAYLSGEINAIATWQPYIDELIAAGDSKVILSTNVSSTLVMDALFFRKDFVDAHPDVVEAMVDGILSVVEDMKNGNDSAKYCEAFRNSLPDFSSSSDSDILSMLNESTLLDWHKNVDAFESSASSMFYDMCSVWDSIGKETYSDFGNDIFDDSFIKNLSSKYQNTSHADVTKSVVSDEDRQSMANDSNALLTKTCSVQFFPNTCDFMNEAEAKAVLDDFVKVAKILDGTIIHITGHVSSQNTSEAEMRLSENRAEFVSNYMIENGISENRVIFEGKGGYEPIFAKPANSDEHKANRRVTASFYIIETE